MAQDIDGDTNDDQGLQPLPEDNDTPFSPPTDQINDMEDDIDREAEANFDDTHQVADSNIEAEEVYDEGLSGAAEATEPNAGNAVLDYDPSKDQRKKDSESDS